MTFLPKTLTGRTILVLLAGLVASNLIGLLIYADERDRALSSIAETTTAERIAAVIQSMERAPSAANDGIVCSQSGPGIAVILASEPTLKSDTAGKHPVLLSSLIQNLLNNPVPERLRIAVGGYGGQTSFQETFFTVMGQCMGMKNEMMMKMMSQNRNMQAMPMMRQMASRMQAVSADKLLRISYRLENDRWLNFTMLSPQFTSIWRSRFFLAFSVMAVVVTILSVWAVRRSTAPLALFAGAAERLGRDVNAPDLPEDGAREVHRAAKAFNDMKRRLRGLINDRTQMLAAISHDLRTPITRLRLRAEFVEDSEQREKMLTDLEQMEAMIASTLAFARDDSANEPRKKLDLAALVQSVCDDASDVGYDVVCTGAQSAFFSGRPLALRRAFANLVDNAVKYGQRARVSIDVSAKHFAVTVEDDGPGIPDSEIERVFEPFYRVEVSRNRETGGAGLGLAVVRSIVRGHGGDVSLSNRPEGGLRAIITLP